MGREMEDDDGSGGNGGGAFKRPGSVPFRWEEKPGVPKIRLHHLQSEGRQHQSLPNTPRKLAPPPCSFNNTVCPLILPRTQSSRSFIWSRSEHQQPQPPQQVKNNNTSLARPAVVSTTSCILSPLFRKKWGSTSTNSSKKKKQKKKGAVQHQLDEEEGVVDHHHHEAVVAGYSSDVGTTGSGRNRTTLTRWSASARKTLSSLWDHQSSSSSSSISSRRSSPQSSRDHRELAGFGLF